MGKAGQNCKNSDPVYGVAEGSWQDKPVEYHNYHIYNHPKNLQSLDKVLCFYQPSSSSLFVFCYLDQ